MTLARLPDRPRACDYTFLGEPTQPFGFPVIDLVRPSARFWSSGPEAPALLERSWDLHRVEAVPTPAALLAAPPATDNVTAQSRRALERLRAFFLVAEDPQRRLEARDVVTLAHQASVVTHVLEAPLRRALLAEEVGLGKTVEAGLIVQVLRRQRLNLRALYLSPARLVRNVEREMRRLGLEFRRFAVQGNAALTDPLVVASIHRAVHPAHLEAVAASGPWDVLIVDECHHLSAWSADGGGKTRQFALVERLLERVRPDGRVLLLSGTPHQGQAAVPSPGRPPRDPGEADDLALLDSRSPDIARGLRVRWSQASDDPQPVVGHGTIACRDCGKLAPAKSFTSPAGARRKSHRVRAMSGGLDSRSNRVIDLIDEGRLDEAGTAAQELLALYPGLMDGHLRLAMVCEARQQPALAAAHYRRAAACLDEGSEDLRADLLRQANKLASAV